MNKLSGVKKIICLRSFWILWGFFALVLCMIVPVIDSETIKEFYWQGPLLAVASSFVIAFAICAMLFKNNLFKRIEEKFHYEDE